MFERILAAVDDSERARLVMLAGRQLLERSGGALVALRVRPANVSGDQVSESDAALAEQTRALRMQGAQAHYLVRHGRPEQQIIETARLQRSTLIVIASRRHGPILASQRRMMARLAAHAPAPVLVIPERGFIALEGGSAHTVFGRAGAPLLVALDGSAVAELALPYAAELAALLDRPLALLYVALPLLSQDERARAWAYVEGARRRMRERISRDARIDVEVLTGMPVDELLWAAEGRRAGVMVLTARGGSGLASGHASFFAMETLRRVEIPALVIPAPALVSASSEQPETERPGMCIE